MSWQTIFSLTNGAALLGWVALAFLPRRPLTMSAILYLGVALLCAAYLAVFVALLGFGVDPVRTGVEAPFRYDVSGIQALLSSEGGVTLAWTHFLAFDLFVGSWIARDADAKDFSRIWQVPILFATLMAGPIGLLIWLVIREPAARRAASGPVDRPPWP